MFNDKKIFILGLARSGYEVAKLLKNNTNSEIMLFSSSDQDPLQLKELEDLGIEIIVRDKIAEYPGDYIMQDIDVIVKNPGIELDHPCCLYANKVNIPIINEVEVAYHFLPDGVKIIGITGSNGKTTTTTIIYEFLKAMKKPVHLAGNIGIPLSKMREDISENDILVIEISDHQLVNLKDFKTDISVLTNLSEVHLDFHGSYDKYMAAKKKIFNHHTKDDLAILNKDNSGVLELTANISSNKLYFSSSDDADIYIKEDMIFYKEPIINIKDIRLKGYHNYENIMCAILATKPFGISNDVIRSVLEEFNGVSHRIEYVREIEGKVFYNDSKSTNVESTITALKSFEDPVILILGGLDRGHEFTSLKEYMKNVRKIICYGEVKSRIKEFANNIGIECLVVETLVDATKTSYEVSNKGDIILLSPACASWDQYKSFEDRGNEFKDTVNNL